MLTIGKLGEGNSVLSLQLFCSLKASLFKKKKSRRSTTTILSQGKATGWLSPWVNLFYCRDMDRVDVGKEAGARPGAQLENMF